MATIAQNRFLEIGRIGKPRGLEGVVRFLPNQFFTDGLFDRDILFYLRNNRSDLVPARVEQVYTESKRNQQLFFVKFDMIASRSDAEQALNRPIYAERVLIEDLLPSKNEQPDFIGYTVETNGEPVGEVLDILENPAHPILEVKVGSGTILIPMVDEYVESTNHNNHTVQCKNLDQLTGL